MAQNGGGYADIWQNDIPAESPFELELREPAPKTVPMKKGGTFDKWKAGVPRSNPIHQGGSNDIEYVWFMCVSNHLKEALRLAGASRVTIVATGTGEDASFEVTKGWRSAGSREGTATSDARTGGYNGRVGRPLPPGETAVEYLAGLLRATKFAHKMLRASSIAEVAESLDKEGRSSFESTILIQAGKIAQSASMAALDSGQDFNAQLKKLFEGASGAGTPTSSEVAISTPSRPESPPPSQSKYPEDEEELPF